MRARECAIGRLLGEHQTLEQMREQLYARVQGISVEDRARYFAALQSETRAFLRGRAPTPEESIRIQRGTRGRLADLSPLTDDDLERVVRDDLKAVREFSFWFMHAMIQSKDPPVQ